MRDRLWVGLLLYPAPLYAALVVLSHYSGGGVGMPVGFALALGFGVLTASGLVRQPLWVGFGRGALLLLIVVPLESGLASGGIWLDVSAGVILGAPFLWLEYAWRTSSSLQVRVLVLQTVLLEGVVALATLNVIPTDAGVGPGAQFIHAWASVVSTQVTALAQVLAGALTTVVPLETVFDPIYVGLGGLALLGLILEWVLPHTAHDEPLPWSWARARPTADHDDERPVEPLALRPGQLDALASRTRPTAPESVFPPGFGALVAAGIPVVVFAILAVTVPSDALLLLALGVTGTVLAVALVLSRRLSGLGGLAG